MTKKKPLTIALGSAFAASLGATAVLHTDQNPFSMKVLSSGYLVAEADDKAKEAQSSEEQSSAEKQEPTKGKEGKCGEGKCGTGKTTVEPKKAVDQ